MPFTEVPERTFMGPKKNQTQKRVHISKAWKPHNGMATSSGLRLQPCPSGMRHYIPTAGEARWKYKGQEEDSCIRKTYGMRGAATVAPWSWSAAH